MRKFHATTIVAIKKGNDVAIAGDGQVTLGESTIMKSTARKVRRLYNGTVLAGFAGSVADAFTLFEKFEKHLDEAHGQLIKAAVCLVNEWRGDQYIKNLEALLILANEDDILLVSGNGEIIVPEDGICAIGSGGNFALASAKALKQNTDLSAKEIATKSLEIAASICVYTNDNIITEVLEVSDEQGK